MNIVIYNSENAPYSKILDLLHRSFKERLSNGMHFDCSTFTLDDYKDKTRDAKIFVAEENNNVIGTITLKFHKKLGINVASHEYVAVDDQYKGRGIATLMIQEVIRFAHENNIDCITSTTMTEAKSSVRYHKKNGFYIYRLDSYLGSNYYSYLFILPVRRFSFIKYSFIRYPIFAIFAIICFITKRKDGSRRFKNT